jgi:hypothetical protein
MSDSSLSGKRLAVLFLALIGAWMIPVWSVDFPPLVDYPNHLARMAILSDGGEDPHLREYYDIRWAVLPNLAMDVVVPFLARFISVPAAGKAFISLIFLVLAGGAMALHRALFAKWAPWPLIAFLFLYNRPLLWGFMNFLFGLGVALWILAGWIACGRRDPSFRLSVFVPLTLLLFFCHLFALGVYGLAIFGVTVYRQRREGISRPWREWATALAPFVLPAVLFLFVSPTGGGAAATQLHFGGLSRKLTAIFQPINNYHRALDAGTALLLAALILTGLGTRTLRVAPPLLYPILLLSLFFLLMPEVLLGVHSVDSRLPNALAFLLAAGTRFQGGRRNEIRVLSLLLALGLLRLGVVGWHWRMIDPTYHRHHSALERMAPGGRLFSAIFIENQWQPFPVPLAHFPCQMITDRSAFVPSLFAYPSQQPVRIAPTYREIADQFPEAVFGHKWTPDWQLISNHFDYVWIVNKDAPDTPAVPRNFAPLQSGSDFAFFRVEK